MKPILFIILFALNSSARADIYACDDNVMTDRPCSGYTLLRQPSKINLSKQIFACDNNVFTDRHCDGGRIIKIQPGPSKEVQKIAWARLQKALKKEEQINRRKKAELEKSYRLSLLERAVTALEYNAGQDNLFEENQLWLPRRIRYTDRRVYNIYY